MDNNPSLHIFGEVLFDHFPDGSRVPGGAPFNVAWHLQAFGQTPRFISRIGDDPPGREISAMMDAWAMKKDALQLDPDHPTGSVQVLIQDGEPHYDIVPDCAYDFIDHTLLEEKMTYGILYHGSLAIRSPVTRAALLSVKARHHGIIFVDVNLRPPWWDPNILLPILHEADWVKLNEAELAQLCPDFENLELAMQAFVSTFDLDTLIVTRGAEGAMACDGEFNFTGVKPDNNIAVVDTVGAGDAFASVLLLALAKKWSLQTALERAQTFASALVGRRGAIVSDLTFYQAISKQWA